MEQNPLVEGTPARRILVVDDESTIAESVAARLRAEGFTVATAPDGPAAVASAQTFEPDLVVLDVMSCPYCTGPPGIRRPTASGCAACSAPSAGSPW